MPTHKGTLKMSVVCTKKDAKGQPFSYVEKRIDGTYAEVWDLANATVFDTIDYLFTAEHVHIQKTFPEAYIHPVLLTVTVELTE